MASIISKILQLGGFFYISLSLVIVIYFFLSNRLKNKVFTIVLLLAMCFTVLVSIYQISKELKELKKFFRSDIEKIETSTFNQSLFANKIRETLNSNDTNCIFWSWDVATKYLIQESYPVRLKTVWDIDSSQKCDYLVSQFTQRPELNLSPSVTFENNFIYRIKK